MSTDMKEIITAYREHERLKAEVTAWMKEQGGKGELRQNWHAPMWRDYEAAVERLHAVGDAMGLLIAEVERLTAEGGAAVIERDRVTIAELRATAERLATERDAARKEADTHWFNFCERSPDARRAFNAEKARDAAQRALAAAQADAARLRAALRNVEWPMRTVDGGPACLKCAHEMYAGHASGCVVGAALATPAGDEALRAFGMKCARAVWSPHVSPEGQRQIEMAVDAVLRGER